MNPVGQALRRGMGSLIGEKACADSLCEYRRESESAGKF